MPISLATTFAQASPGVPSGKDVISSYHKGFEVSSNGAVGLWRLGPWWASQKEGRHKHGLGSADPDRAHLCTCMSMRGGSTTCLQAL